MTSRLDISLLSALWLLLAAALGSCSQIYDPEESCGQEQNQGSRVSLKFKIYTDPVLSRSRGLGEWEEASANVSERILNPDDVRVLMLNNNPEPQLVRTFRPNRLDYVEEGGITGDGYYELSVYFEDENIDRMDNDEYIDFNVMIFANINSLGGDYATDLMGYGTARSRLQELFTMSPYWFPSVDKGIPMYGYRSGIHVTKAQLEDENYNMGDITMLRALSKIEVYDKIVGAVTASDGRKYPYVEKVELISWRDKGYLRPLYDGYEVQGSLKTANIPASSKVLTEKDGGTPVDAYKMDDGVDIDNDNKNDPCFRIYCPEAKLEDLSIRVTAWVAPGKSQQYVESLGKYADGGPNNDASNRIFGNDLVRNHIYRFKVNSLSAMADLTVTVSEWGRQTDEYTLDDIIEMDADGFLKWDIEGSDIFSYTEEKYNGSQQMQLSMLRGTEAYATGTFLINAPKDAEWRAYLIPGENGVDAFEFVDVDAAGNVTGTSSYVTGKVGAPATIRLRGKGPADVYRHYAELVVEVHLPNGTVQYAPLTGSDRTRCIIYRENKL